MIALIMLVAEEIPADLDCHTAFVKFQVKYEKMYDTEEQRAKASDIFCKRYTQLKTLQDTCPECEVTSVYDLPDSFLIQPKMKQLSHSNFFQNAVGAVDCNSVWCYAINTIPNLATLPKSADFRELGLTGVAKNQGSCGSCWAFGTVATLEACFLRGKKFYKAPWAFKAANVAVSEQFVLQNCRGFNQYCNGGQGPIALWQLSSQQKTVELTKNFPYNPTTANNKAAAPKVSTAQYMKPFVEYPVKQIATQTTGAVMLYLNSAKPFDTATITTIKSYLARGFPVLSTMYVGRDQNTFMSYKGTTSFGVAQKCQTYNMDHQVTFVGYGFKGGKAVWILKNSWGPSWGASGFFYAEIGTNTFCIEHYAFGVVPKYVTIDKTAYKADGDVALFIARGSATGIDKD